jgi:septum formation protein
MKTLILASQSPRRRELLKQDGFEFTVCPVKVSEIFDENLNPQDVPEFLARTKAEAALEQFKHLKSAENLILGCDTIVLLGERILGKPENTSVAVDYLSLLSGKTHGVISGLALVSGDLTKVWTGRAITQVTFRELTATEIERYVASGEPMDKAGAYAIQGEGKKFVSSFTGSWSNVVGLPLELLQKALSDNGWSIRKATP